MYNPREVHSLIKYATSGNMPQKDNLEDAEEIIGFPFGYQLDNNGKTIPGPTNEALADYMASDEIIRSKNMTLTDGLALAVAAKDRRLSDQIGVVTPKVNRTYEWVQQVRPQLIERQIGKLAVIAFRFHLPRAEATVRKAGFETAVPDLRDVGDFDSQSAQWQAQSRRHFVPREIAAIVNYAATNKI